MFGRHTRFGWILGMMLWIVAAGMQTAAAFQPPPVEVRIDRTLGDWSELAMGPPSADDDADQSRNPRAVFTYIPSYGKPDPEAGAIGNRLPRLNDGKIPENDDDHANNVWFDTARHSRILLDLGANMDIARINVYSWHAGALAPQQYTLWASDRAMPDPAPEDLSKEWWFIARVDTRPLGEGGKHGSSINSKRGKIGRYRYLLFDIPANKPEWNRSGFLSEIDVYRSGRDLPEIKIERREPARQTLKFGKLDISKVLDQQTNYLVAGKKIYEFAAMDGTFPRIGRDNEQGGIWCHPIKVMDRFETRILEEGQKPVLLHDSSHFVHDFASCEFRFVRNGLKITRQDFAAEDEPALFSRLTLRNATDKPRIFDVEFSGWVRIRPCWGSGLPDQGRSVVEYKGGVVTAYDRAMAGKWGVVFGCDHSPSKHEINGDCGVLTYPVRLPAGGEATLTFLIVGEHEKGVEEARRRFNTELEHGSELLARKQKLYRDRILGGVKFACSNKAIEDAFLCAKANVLLSVMDCRPYFVAPYLAAGFPIYTWLFGCDSCYSTTGVTAAGFEEAACGTLECLLHYASQEKRGAHEVVSNGRLLGTDHVQETPQLVLACWEHFQWTGDRDFLMLAYPVCKEMIDHVLSTADSDHDGYLKGPGLMEQPGMGPERLDAVCYLYAAYESLARMVETLGESGAEDYRRRAAELKLRFNRDWWNPTEKMWACSLRSDHAQTMDNFWAVIFPQQVEIADLDKAREALDRIGKEWVNDEWGCVGQWEHDIKGRGVGVVHNNECALTAFMYGQADLGAQLLRLSAKAPLEARMLGAFNETLPGGGDLIQLWSFGPYLEAVIRGLVGVEPTASEHTVRLYPQMPATLTSYSLKDLEIGADRLNVAWRRDGNTNVLTIAHPRGSQDLKVLMRLGRIQVRTVKLNGKAVRPEEEMFRGVETARVDLSLTPGKTATIRFTQ